MTLTTRYKEQRKRYRESTKVPKGWVLKQGLNLADVKKRVSAANKRPGNTWQVVVSTCKRHPKGGSLPQLSGKRLNFYLCKKKKSYKI